MRSRLLLLLALAGTGVAPRGLVAQGVIVDQGQFAVSLAGAHVGTEDFSIRRAGLGREDAIFANAVVALTRNGERQEIRPLLRATPPDGIAIEYQVEVVGVDSMQVGLRRVSRRYVATIHSGLGEEQREFPAHEQTRILDADVAHQHYFLRDVIAGSVTPVLVPRARARLDLTAGPPVEEEIRVGNTVVAARRVEFTSSDERRVVWFDRLGRVLRVEIPAVGYLAERTDILR